MATKPREGGGKGLSGWATKKDLFLRVPLIKQFIALSLNISLGRKTSKILMYNYYYSRWSTLIVGSG